MDNLRRAILVITIIVLLGAAVIGFMLALNGFGHKDDDSVINLLPEGEKYNPDSSASPETPEVPGDANRYTGLFVVTGDVTGQPELVFSASADYDALKLNLVFYPVDTFVSLKTADGSEFKTISGYYADGGYEKLKEACDGILGIPSDNVLVFSFESLSKFINCFTSRDSGVLYNVPCAINSDGYNGRTFTVKAGLGYFVGNNSANLLSFFKNVKGVYDSDTVKFYDGTRYPQNAVAATFAKAFFEQKLTGTLDQYYLDNFISYFDELFASSKGTADQDIPKRFKESGVAIPADNIRAYVIACTETGAAGNSVYAGSIVEVENVDGFISSKEISGNELSALLTTFY
ncbi:MAG: hypothetical protein ILO53_03710 [Clostridia bacterium]|nr:hypothetical protein [Clostridia bacterium]